MERISVFDIFKVGVGPSSSHTMGPWRAAQTFVKALVESELFEKVASIQVELFGSLAKTGKGHGTDIAVLLGLDGHDAETIDVTKLNAYVDTIYKNKEIHLLQQKPIAFDPTVDLIFHMQESLPFHANGMIFRAFTNNDLGLSKAYYSIGGGFIVEEGQAGAGVQRDMPYPIDSGADLKKWTKTLNLPIHEVVLLNELAWRPAEEVSRRIDYLWDTMKACIFNSFQHEGVLPGGLNVQRRAKAMTKKLLQGFEPKNVDELIVHLQQKDHSFNETLKWLSCFALAVNEENAAFGRIVTAPTNGAAGVIPAVLMYHCCFNKSFNKADIPQFLLTAGEMGSLFKKGATISAAMGGCQAEIGVSSAMAAAALTSCLGGDAEQAMMAAEIAMEHHLGLTCDPVGGLVQIPCIERNTMGAIKAVTACFIALESDPAMAKVSLDAVIKTMKETAEDMSTKYKETADGGLATSVGLVEC